MDDYLEDLDADPVAQFTRWFADARDAGLPEPEAMALATATRTGVPSVRMVLLKGHDERGFTFFTNRESRKARELEETGRAAAVFHWRTTPSRQVRIEGTVETLSDEESLAYFVTRARASRLGAWASPQSRPIADRDELERRLRDVEARFPGEDVPLPPFWGGYRIRPGAVELWQGRSGRLHDRVRYEREDGGTWSRRRLAP